MALLSSSTIANCVCVTAVTVMAEVTGRTVALAANTTSQCDRFEYYDVSAGTCKPCDTACFEYENGTIVGFTESRCLQMCPGYIKEPRVPQYPREPEEVSLTVMEGCLIGFIISLFILCLIVTVVLRSEIYTALKDCGHSAKSLSSVSDMCGHSTADVTETSYVKLADPSDEVEIIDRVTCV
ncbi:uncharacterized protein LOC143287943 [Babylonia areolata]|uniref:uncharacterized protein LOC143287943 n=1 Tax=Babylonia areolata TaxID=304850 RepID=UPI003FCFAEFF